MKNTKEYGADKYYKELDGKKVICVDFDNTICLDEWPYVGPVVLGACKVLKELLRNGHRLILFTQRSKHYPVCCKELKEYASEYGSSFSGGDEVTTDGEIVDILSWPLEVCEEHGIDFVAYNSNPDWEICSQDFSRKVFADYFIDDHNVGMKYIIIRNKMEEMCKVCDWRFIDEWFVNEGLYPERVFL